MISNCFSKFVVDGLIYRLSLSVARKTMTTTEFMIGKRAVFTLVHFEGTHVADFSATVKLDEFFLVIKFEIVVKRVSSFRSRALRNIKAALDWKIG